jgi:hypothetical protein
MLQRVRKWLDADDELARQLKATWNEHPSVRQLRTTWDERLTTLRDRAVNVLAEELARRNANRPHQLRSGTLALPAAAVSASSAELVPSPRETAQWASVFNVTCAPVETPDEDLPRRVGEAAGGSTFATVNGHYRSEYGRWQAMFTLVVANPPADARERMGQLLDAPWYIERVAELRWTFDPERGESVPYMPATEPEVLPPAARYDDALVQYDDDEAWHPQPSTGERRPQPPPEGRLRDPWYERGTPEQKARLDELRRRAQRAQERASPRVKAEWDREDRR